MASALLLAKHEALSIKSGRSVPAMEQKMMKKTNKNILKIYQVWSQCACSRTKEDGEERKKSVDKQNKQGTNINITERSNVSFYS